MDGSVRRLFARGLMLVAALLAMCAFHSPTESAETALANSMAIEMIGPLHLDFDDVPEVLPVADSHTHRIVPSLLGLSILLVAARAIRVVALRPVRPAAIRARFGVPAAFCPSAVSLTQLRISRT
ncbi:hypothetical protein HPO96_08160 [Kribbella sandramycini]|uniref:Uncharacterized protein n=1 Tax=Kribbella sandramycini TaxID=60450 RepID=A0A7Y4KWY2_9ACTN|nr:hypothetical protein [Kribbella sandramycini]MBB6569961.1 hypothetical protein [Kribbella sandramycini]NOL40215.1 hypothetical protein [Kribbella sandramycini]